MKKVRCTKSSAESWVTLLLGYLASVWIIVETPNKILKIATNLIITHGEFYVRPHSGPKMSKKGQMPQKCKTVHLDTIFFWYHGITCKMSRFISKYRTLTSEVIWGQNLFFFFTEVYIFISFYVFSQMGLMGPSMKLIFTTYRFRAIFYILVCLNRAIFKESIGGQKGQKEVTQLKIGKFPFICIILVQIPIWYSWYYQI